MTVQDQKKTPYSRTMSFFISLERYFYFAIILSLFMLYDVYEMICLYISNEWRMTYHTPALAQLLLSMFGAQLSIWTDIDMKAYFDIENMTDDDVAHVQIFAYLLCVLPMLCIVFVSAISKWVEAIDDSYFFKGDTYAAHNFVMLLYTLAMMYILFDLALFFRRHCKKNKAATTR